MSVLVLLVQIILFIPTLCYGTPVIRYNEGELNDAVEEILPKNGELFEGDIIMDDRLRNAIRGRKIKRVSRTFDGSLTWPNGTIPYIYAEDFCERSRLMLNKAFEAYERRTCIRFKQRQNETDYIVFSAPKSGYCSSYIGRVGGPQVVNLGRQCLIIGSFKHEIMHALGILHEQSRPDRDDYVDVLYRNIKKVYWSNFHKYKVVDNLKGEFNFASIMMYPNKAFTKNGNDTIDAVGDPQLRFGQRERFSIGDVKEINYIYNCKEQLKRPNYAGLYGEYHGNAKRKEIIERRKQLIRRDRNSTKGVLYKSTSLHGPFI